MNDRELLKQSIDRRSGRLTELSDAIWALAELPYEETQSAAMLAKALEAEGFTVTMGVADIPTAFVARATVGEGGCVMGFLGEYDALDILSQEAGNPVRSPVREGAPGHGCGHNALGVGALGAAVAVKEVLQATGRSATVIYYGCAAEEGAGAKQFMARAGLFDPCDFIYTWHPATKNAVDSTCCNAIMGANFTFRGLASHAGASPHLGRSALDAAELMSVGVNYLREHIVDGARVHYAYANAGGTAPNVVQDYAQVKYEVRSPKVAQVKELFERVVKVAQGAALMTETAVEVDLTMAFSDYIPNDALARVADACMQEIGAPNWEEEDYALAKSFLATYNQETTASIRKNAAELYGADRVQEILERPLDSEIHPYSPDKINYSAGSTDVGDVCYVVPTLNLNVATACIGNVGHSWQMTAQSGSRLAHKGLLTAAKMMALSALRTMEQPDVIARAKELVLSQNGGAYQCPLPDNIAPPVGRY